MTDETQKQPERPRQTHRMMAILLGLLMGSVAFNIVLWRQGSGSQTPSRGTFKGTGIAENLVRKKYPQVDFQKVYPGMSGSDIDELQTACSAIRYAYEPFVQFIPRAMTNRFVNINDHGIRQGSRAAPWPPDEAAINVFVFGGSTTLGYHLPDNETVPAVMEQLLRSRLETTNLWCYNFGSGYHFSSQERARFAALLAERVEPDAAIFIDGLNEFYHPEGFPQFSYDFFRFAAPGAIVPNRLLFSNHAAFTDEQRPSLVHRVILRLQRNFELTRAMARQAGVEAFFVGQPVPFYAYPNTDPDVHPFGSPTQGTADRLCEIGYERIQEFYGGPAEHPQLIWLGEIFRAAEKPMYADKVHYSPRGARLLAAAIVRECLKRGLLKDAPKLRSDY